MRKQDQFAFIITFFFGFSAGFYLYLVGFSPNYSFDFGSDDQPELVIVAERYGNCETNGVCAVFRLENSGAYRFAPAAETLAEQTFSEGELSRDLMRQLQTAIVDTGLSEMSELTDPLSCPSFTDGDDTVYTITTTKDEFVLDTCGTKFTNSSELGQTLLAVWAELEASE